MKLMLTPDDMVAKVWDDYLHWFGAGAYVMARYICAPPTTPMNENASEVPLDLVRSQDHINFINVMSEAADARSDETEGVEAPAVRAHLSSRRAQLRIRDPFVNDPGPAYGTSQSLDGS